jgi:hypothetical protein
VVVIIILTLIYFFRFRDVKYKNAIAEIIPVITVNQIEIDIHKPYVDLIPSAPPLSSPLYDVINISASQIIPLTLERKVELTYSCVSCSDFKLHVEKGVMCGNIEYSHFICNSKNNDCFSAMITSQTNDLAAFMKYGNYITCAYCTALDSRIVTPFDEGRVVKYSNPVALAAYKCAISESANVAPVCMICLDGPKVIALLPCGHKAYCAECFIDPILSQGNCPYCRTPITGTVRLFD